MIKDAAYLPSAQARYCTRKAKIEPMEEFIGSEEATIYLGIRADEPFRNGYKDGKENIDVIYPLKDVGYTIIDVYKLCEHYDLMPPTFFWQEIYDRTVLKLGKQKDRLDLLAPWQLNRLFAGRSRTNCYHCFFQRQYEWVWLYETHPDLFQKAQDLELIGEQDERQKRYYWIGKNYPLSKIIQRKEIIKSKRVDDIVFSIVPERRQKGKMTKAANAVSPTLFESLRLEFIEVDATSSCGVFCGK